MAIEGIKLIRHNARGVDLPDDPTYPHRLDAILRPPEFMQIAFLLLYGNEEICVRGMTREALEKFVTVNNLRNHPRLISLTIS